MPGGVRCGRWALDGVRRDAGTGSQLHLRRRPKLDQDADYDLRIAIPNWGFTSTFADIFAVF